jgi:hypothetical protein
MKMGMRGGRRRHIKRRLWIYGKGQKVKTGKNYLGL